LEIKIGAMVDLATANACIMKIKCLQMLANACKIGAMLANACIMKIKWGIYLLLSWFCY
jgi:hypothetical protein